MTTIMGGFAQFRWDKLRTALMGARRTTRDGNQCARRIQTKRDAGGRHRSDDLSNRSAPAKIQRTSLDRVVFWVDAYYARGRDPGAVLLLGSAGARSVVLHWLTASVGICLGLHRFSLQPKFQDSRTPARRREIRRCARRFRFPGKGGPPGGRPSIACTKRNRPGRRSDNAISTMWCTFIGWSLRSARVGTRGHRQSRPRPAGQDGLLLSIAHYHLGTLALGGGISR